MFLQTGSEIALFDLLLDIAVIVGILIIVAAFVWLYWKSPPKR